MRKCVESGRVISYYSETISTGATQCFFSQSQDKLRTKELEFVDQQLNLPLTVIGPLMKEVQCFCSELVLWLSKKNVGWPWLSSFHCNYIHLIANNITIDKSKMKKGK